MDRRRTRGEETTARLLNWGRDSASAERLAVLLLHADGFRAIDPIHPLGGPDGLKDAICEYQGNRWTVGVNFPRGQQPFTKIKKKFRHDLASVAKNNAKGFAFVTNQELCSSKRKILAEAAPGIIVEVFHLERISSILNRPQCYGVRLEFLDIEMEKEEQLAFYQALSSSWELQREQLNRIETRLLQQGQDGAVPLQELREFREVVNSITYDPLTYGGFGAGIPRLNVPLETLLQFKELLHEIVGHRWSGGLYQEVLIDRLQVPLAELQEFERILRRVDPNVQGYFSQEDIFSRVYKGLQDLQEYETRLQRILVMQQTLQANAFWINTTFQEPASNSPQNGTP